MRDGMLLVICLTLLIGVGIPAGLYFGMRRGGGIGQVDLLRQAGRRALRPWQPENEDLKKLAKEVEKLREPNENA